MENLTHYTPILSTLAATLFSLGGTLAVLKFIANKHDKKIEQIEENQKSFVEKAAHEADMKEIHERLTKKDDELKKSVENLEKEIGGVAREISRIVGFIEGRERK